MTQTIRTHLADLLRTALSQIAPETDPACITLERPKQAAHGDFASNLPLQIAKNLRTSPRDIAERLLAALPISPWLDHAEIAGAGFINFHLTAACKLQIIHDILTTGSDYGRNTLGQGQRLQIEFVSANPTGPLHVGHGRGAAYGASLAELLAFSGWQVSREYYVNDAGRQMDILALSTWLRYLEQQTPASQGTPSLEAQLSFPPNAYQGDYVRDMAQQLAHTHPTRLLRPIAAILANTPGLPNSSDPQNDQTQQLEHHLDALIANAKILLDDDWSLLYQHVLAQQLADVRADLAEFGVHFDIWFSETSLYDNAAVAQCIQKLDAAGYLYEKDGALWFRSSTLGDEKDRVIRRENGLYTYFASDIAYHLNKFERGFDRIINIWGADHHGYIPRVKGALQALGQDTQKLHIALVQFAVLYRQGQKAAMSTRAGEFVTLRELRQEVGKDACRFFYVLRKSDQHLDFDLDLAKSHSTENPVYYIQYAHARICALINSWQTAGGELNTLAHTALQALTSKHELALAARLAEFPEVIIAAANELAPHSIAFYLKDLAAEFHSWYNAERILDDNIPRRDARIALAAAIRQTLRNGLSLLGVSHPDSMQTRSLTPRCKIHFTAEPLSPKKAPWYEPRHETQTSLRKKKHARQHPDRPIDRPRTRRCSCGSCRLVP